MDAVLKILLIEDSVSDAEILKAFLLSHKPHCVFKVVMTEDAFNQALDAFVPDVIISDNTLPQFSATDALDIFTRRNLPIPFILVTGTVSEEFAVNVIKAGADDYILKDRLTRLPSAIDAALEKKKTEAERKKAEELIRFKANLLKAVGEAVIATDLAGTVLYWNYAAENIYGWQASEAMGRNIMEITPAGQSVEEAAAIMLQLQQGRSWSGECMVQRKDGTRFPAYVSDSPFFDQEGKLSGIIGISYDLTGQKEAEARMRLMEKKMARQLVEEQKKISRAIIRGQEAEKNHIGRELHDNINQILAGAKMFLVSAGKKDETIKELVSYPVELLNDSIEEIRRLTYRQVTPLKDIMLKEQLGKLFEGIEQAAPVLAELDFNIDEQLFSDELKLNLYRIVQEQLTNIVKHAAAKKIQVSVSKQDNNIVLAIADDGCGFDTTVKRKGIGISNIINRVTSYNGTLDISSGPGKGTVLTAWIPY
jgi:two-component system, NarL family, sensor histidine kinase UhpB